MTRDIPGIETNQNGSQQVAGQKKVVLCEQGFVVLLTFLTSENNYSTQSINENQTLSFSITNAKAQHSENGTSCEIL